MMKNILLAIAVIILFSQCNRRRTANHCFVVNVDIIGETTISSNMHKDHRFYKANIDLINNCDTIIHFWIMTCSWEDNFIFNNDSFLYFYNAGCDGNFPKLVQIEPNNKISYTGIIDIADTSTNLNYKTYKLGFLLIKEKEYDYNDDYHLLINEKIKNKDAIIWSNEFRLKK